jgi:acetyl-CoA hydrolase
MTREIDAATLDFGAHVRPGDTVLWGQSSAEPLPLTRALMAQRHAVGGRFRVFLGIGAYDTVQPEHLDCIDAFAYCGTGTNRTLVRSGHLDILPCHYARIPDLIRSGPLRIDVLLLQLAGPDASGEYSLGIAHEFLYAALETARVVIAEVNAEAPWTFGSRSVRAEELDLIVHTRRPIVVDEGRPPSEIEAAIAGHVAGLIEDGATLQFGLGAIPEAVLSRLNGHRDLGVHSGTIGDGVAELMEAGVITNARKGRDVGATVTGLMSGSTRLHRFAHRNAQVQFRATEYTHAPEVLASLPRFTAINSALQVDLGGQINAEVAGGRYVGAVGGALDFLRGAARSPNGLPIIALPSRAGETSRIVAHIDGPVTTPRSDAALIVTEYGVADLRGATLAERARRLIAIAHPDMREMLARACHSNFSA